MHPRELMHRINDLEARVAELEGATKVLEASSGKAEQVKEIDERLQSVEDWRANFEKASQRVAVGNTGGRR